MRRRSVSFRAVWAATAMAAVASCGRSALMVPTADEVESHYAYTGTLSVEMRGNLAEISVTQPADQLRRGGTLWAKVGPYVLLFSEETQDLFEEFGGLAGIRVVTTTSGGREVARALLARDAMNELTWRRALNISGKARRDGTRRPSLLEELVRWGEDHTEFEYDPRYVPQ